MISVDHQLGDLSARVKILEARTESMDAKLDELVAMANQSRGGFRVLVWVAGAAGMAGACVSAVVGWSISLFGSSHP